MYLFKFQQNILDDMTAEALGHDDSEAMVDTQAAGLEEAAEEEIRQKIWWGRKIKVQAQAKQRCC